jgi:hypothetical protein
MKETYSETKMLMNTQSGDVASERDWRDDFEHMGIESWFSIAAGDISDDRHWLDNTCRDSGEKILVEVKKDNDGEWVEA